MRRGREFAAGLLAAVASAAWGALPAQAAVGCGSVIKHDVTLQADLVCNTRGLKIGADGVTLNLNGHKIDGQNVGSTGIEVGYHHKHVKIDGQGDAAMPGLVTGFNTGVVLDDVAYSKVKNLHADYNAFGIVLQGLAHHNKLKNLTASHNSAAFGGNGITLLDSSFNSLKLITADYNNGSGIVLGGFSTPTSDGNSLTGGSSASHNNAHGVAIDGGKRNTVANLGLNFNTLDGLNVNATSKRTLVTQNQADDNGSDGLDVESTDAGTVIAGNHATANQSFGIRAAMGVTDGGLNQASGNSITNCSANIACTP